MAHRSTLREVIAGVVGFLIFMCASAVLFYAAGYDPYEPVARSFQVMSVAYGVVFALISGYVAAVISPASNGRPVLMVALLIAVLAIVSLLTGEGVEAWSQISALILMAPAVVVGGRLRNRGRS